MTKIDVYNSAGKKTGTMDLDSAVFEAKMNNSLLHQVVTALSANKRKVISNTKTRSERRGGGAKPWRQKGTGRARAGSNRSPLWKKGGIIFGPRSSQNFKQKINKKIGQLAMKMVLSAKVSDKELIILDKLEMPEIKTQKIRQIIEKLPLKNTLILLLPAKDMKKEDSKTNVNIRKSARNLPYLKVFSVENLNILDSLKYKSILATKQSISELNEKLKGK